MHWSVLNILTCFLVTYLYMYGTPFWGGKYVCIICHGFNLVFAVDNIIFNVFFIFFSYLLKVHKMFITKSVLYFYCHYMFGIVKLCLIYVGQWDSMEEYMCLIPRNSYNGAFYRAVFALHTENYQQAQQVQYLYTVHTLYSTQQTLYFYTVTHSIHSVKQNYQQAQQVQYLYTVHTLYSTQQTL